MKKNLATRKYVVKNRVTRKNYNENDGDIFERELLNQRVPWRKPGFLWPVKAPTNIQLTPKDLVRQFAESPPSPDAQEPVKKKRGRPPKKQTFCDGTPVVHDDRSKIVERKCGHQKIISFPKLDLSPKDLVQKFAQSEPVIEEPGPQRDQRSCQKKFTRMHLKHRNNITFTKLKVDPKDLIQQFADTLPPPDECKYVKRNLFSCSPNEGKAPGVEVDPRLIVQQYADCPHIEESNFVEKINSCSSLNVIAKDLISQFEEVPSSIDSEVVPLKFPKAKRPSMSAHKANYLVKQFAQSDPATDDFSRCTQHRLPVISPPKKLSGRRATMQTVRKQRINEAAHNKRLFRKVAVNTMRSNTGRRASGLRGRAAKMSMSRENRKIQNIEVLSISDHVVSKFTLRRGRRCTSVRGRLASNTPQMSDARSRIKRQPPRKRNEGVKEMEDRDDMIAVDHTSNKTGMI